MTPAARTDIAALMARLRLLQADHQPDAWPAVQMRDITALVDELERLRIRERSCETLDAAEKVALVRTLQECAATLGMPPSTTPAELVRAMTRAATPVLFPSAA